MALVPFPGTKSGAVQARPPEPDDDDLETGKMSFLEHLDELRKRIIWSCIGIFVGILGSIYWISDIVHFLLAPAIRVMPEGSTLIMTQPGEGFSVHVTVALIAGAVIAAPFLMYQVWRFIAPGLYANEKKFAIPFVLLSSAGFIGGAAFNHYIAFPSLMAFFARFDEINLRFSPTLSLVFGLYVKMLLGLGFVFQMPTIVFFLSKMQVITAGFLIRRFKIAFMIFVVTAAVITPTSDPVNLAIFTAPMVALYVLSIAIAWMVSPRRSREATETAT
jgi:sec-independent protein translocase protein TatC